MEPERPGTGARILLAAAPPTLFLGLALNAAACLFEAWSQALAYGTGIVGVSLGMHALGSHRVRRAAASSVGRSRRP